MKLYEESTIGKVLQVIEKTLTEAGIDSPVSESRLLVAYAMNMGFLEILMHQKEAIPSLVMEKINNWVKRRLRREPLQLIIGIVQFRGLELIVKKGVLIPRPETEIVVDKAVYLWQQYGERLPHLGIDLGSGCGCIALALAQEIDGIKMVGVDLSRHALALADHNCKLNGLDERVCFVEANWLDSFTVRGKVGMIIANPPYIRTEELERLAPEVKGFDPHLGLDGGISGCDAYYEIISNAEGILAPGGMICLECGDGRVDEIFRILDTAGFKGLSKGKDLTGSWRVVWGYYRVIPGDI